ncbi:MAG: hypothetical protein P8Z49_05650 [Acidobacteriota bacterium]
MNHGLNPFVTHYLWAPTGFNLAWATSVPALAVLVSPFTLFFGPAATYNILTIAAPALSAWGAFLLCRYLTGHFGAALTGGFLFGFSTFQSTQALGHLANAFAFLIPIGVLLVLKLVRKGVTPIKFTISMTAIMVLQFGISKENFATSIFFGVIVGALAFWIFPERRSDLAAAGMWSGLALLLAALPLSPYLVFVLKGLRTVPKFIHSPAAFSADLMNFMTPTRLTMLGGNTFENITRHFSGNLAEHAAYLGLPLLALVILYFIEFRKTRTARLTALAAGVIFIASLGPVLHIAGNQLFPLPWAILQHLPLLGQALPARFPLYLFLIFSILASFWVHESRKPVVVRTVLAAAALLFLAPRFSPYFEPLKTPTFFAGPEARQRLAPDENCLVLPCGPPTANRNMYWQVKSGMSFKLAEGYLGLMPSDAARWPLIQHLLSSSRPPDVYTRQVEAFLGSRGVGAVIVTGPERLNWRRFLEHLPGKVTMTGQVLVYYVPETIRRRYVDATPESAQFEDLLAAGRQWLHSRSSATGLNPLAAEDAGFLAKFYGGYPADAPNANWTPMGGWLGPWGGDIGVGVTGSWTSIQPILKKYGKLAKTIYYPYPSALKEKKPLKSPGQLLLVFAPSVIREMAGGNVLPN